MPVSEKTSTCKPHWCSFFTINSCDEKNVRINVAKINETIKLYTNWI